MIACPRCRAILTDDSINTGDLHPCPVCAVPIRADVFNALARRDGQNASPENILVSGDAECFDHPGKKAIAACDACGRLLCDLCRVELSGRNLCMRCLQSARDKKKIEALQNRRVLNDAIALHLSFWPGLIIFPTLITAPAAVFFAVRHWRTPAGVLKKPFAMSIVAFLLATGQIAGWVIFFILLSRGVV